MGYHIYDFAEFRLSAIGRHSCYLYLFTQDKDTVTIFAEKIGMNAVSVSQGIEDLDWMFACDRPLWLSPHAYYYATICVICPRKVEAGRFLGAYKKYREWIERAAFSDEELSRSPSDILTKLDNTIVVSVPRTHNPDFHDHFRAELKSQAKPHDLVMLKLAKLVETGLARKAAAENNPALLAERIQILSGIDTYVAENAVLVDTLHGTIVDINEQRKSIFEGIRAELGVVKKQLKTLASETEIQQLLTELKKVNKTLTDGDWGRTPLSVQATAGIEVFGNGIKLVFDSRGLSTNSFNKISRLMNTLRRLHQPGAETRHKTVE